MSKHPTRVLLITGYSRSGSTLLARILGEVDGFVAPGELRYLWRRGLMENRRCDCGERFVDCPFWRKVLNRAFGSTPPPDLQGILSLQSRVDRVFRIPALTRAGGQPTGDVASYLNYYEHLYEAIEEVSGASYIVDSSKDPPFGHVLALSGSIDLSVIHLVRDSRAVAYSWTREKHDPGTGRPMSRQHPLRSALEWDLAQWTASRLTRRVDRAKVVAYERFVAEPETVVSEVLDMLGEDVPAPVRGNTVRLHSGHGVSGNPMRFETGEIDINGDHAWRDSLPRPSRLLVTAITWPGLSSHGYLGRVDAPA